MKYFITKVKDYKNISKELIDKIDSIPKNPFSQFDDQISHTDWNIPRDVEREYSKIFIDKVLKPYMPKIASKLKSRDWSVQNHWFFQYQTNDKQDWHLHEHTQFANVYFVELPTKSSVTDFLDFKSPKVEEGDILSFPAYLYHRSKPLRSKKRKTIIAFNTSFHNYNGL